MPERYRFIPELRTHLAENMTGSFDRAIETIKQWESGLQPQDEYEREVFLACDQVLVNIRRNRS